MIPFCKGPTGYDAATEAGPEDDSGWAADRRWRSQVIEYYWIIHCLRVIRIQLNITQFLVENDTPNKEVAIFTIGPSGMSIDLFEELFYLHR